MNLDFSDTLREQVLSRSTKTKKREGATSRDLVRAFRETSSKRVKVKMFFKLWFIHAKSRRILIPNLFFTAIMLPNSFLTDVIQATKDIEHKKITDFAPQTVQNLATVLNHIIRGKSAMLPTDWRDLVMKHTKKTISRIVSIQVILSLLETIMLLSFADKKQNNLSKAMLQQSLGKMGVDKSKTDKMNMDQMRLELAESLVKKI